MVSIDPNEHLTDKTELDIRDFRHQWDTDLDDVIGVTGGDVLKFILHWFEDEEECELCGQLEDLVEKFMEESKQ